MDVLGVADKFPRVWIPVDGCGAAVECVLLRFDGEPMTGGRDAGVRGGELEMPNRGVLRDPVSREEVEDRRPVDARIPPPVSSSWLLIICGLASVVLAVASYVFKRPDKYRISDPLAFANMSTRNVSDIYLPPVPSIAGLCLSQIHSVHQHC